jgi:hypothetical protein
LKEIKIFCRKGKKLDLNQLNNIMKENRYIEGQIIYDIEDQYIRNGKRKNVLKFLNDQIAFEELDKKINGIKKHLDRKFENINFPINDIYSRYDKELIRKKYNKSFDYSFDNIYFSPNLNNYKESDSNYYKSFNDDYSFQMNNEYINKKRNQNL